jgi:rSAM/selenodomain-associated transferase 2
MSLSPCQRFVMISVVIPTLNAERELAATLTALVPAAVNGLIREVIIVDGGSTDRTRKIAEASGADVVDSPAGRGQQLAVGGAKARGPWLLFLHADTVLDEDWTRAALNFMNSVNQGDCDPAAAAFRFRLDDKGLTPRLLEAAVALRCKALRLPYGDQGLLISRRLYEKLGGFKALPVMEDVDIVRRLGRSQVVMLDADATTSAGRYRRDGYLARTARNLFCLTLYAAGVSPAKIAHIYRRQERSAPGLVRETA